MKLRPYQTEIARAVMDSVCRTMGLTFSVEIARQGGKNELSAHLEVLLLTMHIARGGNLVKASPTFKPQTVISMLRLKERLDDYGFAGLWHAEMGYIVRLGEARAIFLSAEETANVVGNTCHLLLEMDESQDISPDKYTKDFKPMGPPPMLLSFTTGPPGTTARCWRWSNRPTSSSSARAASDATSATTGRKWPNTTRPTPPTWRANASGWARTIPCSAPSTGCSPYTVEAVSSPSPNAANYRGTTAG